MAVSSHEGVDLVPNELEPMTNGWLDEWDPSPKHVPPGKDPMGWEADLMAL